MEYHLTLPQGTITLRNHIFTGSETQGSWSPFNPNNLGGWKDGDTLTVVCTFNLNPDLNPLPSASEYWGLCVGACAATDNSQVQSLLNQARGLSSRYRTGALLGNYITTETDANYSYIFYKATSTAVTVDLQPSSRGTLTNYIFRWDMTYNGNNRVVSSGDDVELVYGYGDPQYGDDES